MPEKGKPPSELFGGDVVCVGRCTASMGAFVLCLCFRVDWSITDDVTDAVEVDQPIALVL